tara:strand:- start:283 stop:744 length:462 start_codon:yes stop_codon:yes gene_type:complete
VTDVISADVSSVNATVDIQLDFNSKNKLLTDTTTVSDVFSSTTIYSRAFTESIVTIEDEIVVAVQYNLAITDAISSSDAFLWTVDKNIVETISTGDTPTIGQIYLVNPTESITVSDLMVTYHDGMLNTNMLNTRLISTGDLEVLVSDVSVTLS